MKALLLIPALFFGAVSAQAEVILPSLYASEYCSLRSMGADHNGASRAAMRDSLVSGTPVKVIIGGDEIDADVVQAFREVKRRCPQYLN